MWASDLQLAGRLAIPGQLLPLIIHNAHVCEQGRPPLSHAALHLLCLAQRQLTALHAQRWSLPWLLVSNACVDKLAYKQMNELDSDRCCSSIKWWLSSAGITGDGVKTDDTQH